MKAVILAGGFGTRISEESHLKPKPMIEIGGNQTTGYQRQRLCITEVWHEEIPPEFSA
jgi:NDP-sugar pyrophosphorylase family protein